MCGRYPLRGPLVEPANIFGADATLTDLAPRYNLEPPYRREPKPDPACSSSHPYLVLSPVLKEREHGRVIPASAPLRHKGPEHLVHNRCDREWDPVLPARG